VRITSSWTARGIYEMGSKHSAGQAQLDNARLRNTKVIEIMSTYSEEWMHNAVRRYRIYREPRRLGTRVLRDSWPDRRSEPLLMHSGQIPKSQMSCNYRSV
jgi:hypothetical protein